jgi:hypothetical protein
VTVRFVADEDLDVNILRGLRAREPVIDILDVKTSGLRGRKDPDLLALAALQGRIVISHDRDTMPRHFRARIEAGKPAPGLFIVSQRESTIGAVIDSIVLVWAASEAEEWRNQIVYLPL